MIFARISGVAVLAFLSYLLYEKGLKFDAMGTNADGAGIGTSFLGFEINDRVPEESIPKYAKGFFVASGVVLVIGLDWQF